MTEKEYYFPSEISELLGPATPSMTTFYRRVHSGQIRQALVEGHPELRAYTGEDVRTFLRGGFTIQRGGSRRRKLQVNGEHSQVRPAAARGPLVRALTNDDIGAAYYLLFEALGIEHAAPPMSMRRWQEKYPGLYWVVSDPVNLKDIWAVLGVLPLEEELIVRLLREEMTLQEVEVADLLASQPERGLACYISAAVAPGKREDCLVLLLRHLLSFWCDGFPGVSIRTLYASAHASMEMNPVLRMLQTFFFGQRLDVGEGAWQLRFDLASLSPDVQQFQKCILQKQTEREKSMLVLEEIDTHAADRQSPFAGPLSWRRAATREDVAAMVQIGAEIFLPPGAQPSISNEHQVQVWYSWLLKNPDIFHLVEGNGEVIGYISLIPLPQDIIDKVMRGAHPTTITPDDVLLFESGRPLDTYVHIWGTTPRLNDEQKTKAGVKMLKELTRMFDEFARQGIEIRSIYTRSNKKDGIRISRHLGLEEIEVPGVTDAADEHDRKHVFCLNVAESRSDFAMQYRVALERFREGQVVSSNS